MLPNEYRCANCGGVFEKTWSDEDAIAEMKDNFGDLPESERAVVCDDCFHAIMGANK